MTYVTMGSCCNSPPCHNSCDRMQAGQISWPLHEGQALFNVIRSPWMSHERKINCIRFRFLCYHRVIYCRLHYPLTSSYFFFFSLLLFGSRWQGERGPCPYLLTIPAVLQKSEQFQWCVTIFSFFTQAICGSSISVSLFWRISQADYRFMMLFVVQAFETHCFSTHSYEYIFHCISMQHTYMNMGMLRLIFIAGNIF